MPKFKKGERVEWFGKSGEILGNVTFCFEKSGYTNVTTVMYDNGNYDQISMDRLRQVLMDPMEVNKHSLKDIIDLTWEYKDEKN